jgi:hypothetical protein
LAKAFFNLGEHQTVLLNLAEDFAGRSVEGSLHFTTRGSLNRHLQQLDKLSITPRHSP